MNFHILRMESVYYAIKSGQGIKSYVYELLLSGYGYGAGIFYPDIFLYPAVLFRFIGASPEIAMKLLIGICFVATCFTSYQAGKHIGRDYKIGIITMIIYTMGQYHFIDAYIRSAIGEFIAMIFIPLVFWGLYELTENGYKKKGILCIAFTGLMLSNTVSLALCGMMAVLWVLVRIKRVWSKRCISGVILEALACLLITAFYWLPVFEQFTSDVFNVSESPSFYPSQNVMTFKMIYGGVFSISFIEIGIMLLLIAFGIKDKRYSKKSIVFAVAVVVLLIVETGIFPWKLIDKTIFVSIQFPWRLNMFTEFFAAMAIGCQAKAFFGDKNIIRKANIDKTDKSSGRSPFSRHSDVVIYAACVALGLFHVLTIRFSYMNAVHTEYVDYPDNYIEIEENTIDFLSEEWLPVSFDIDLIHDSENKNKAYTDDGYDVCTYNDDGSLEFLTNVYSGYAAFPKVYYKGYEALALLGDGSYVNLDVYESEDGLLCADIPEGTYSVLVWYEGTLLQRLSMCISCICVIFMLIGFICWKKHKKYVSMTE